MGEYMKEYTPTTYYGRCVLIVVELRACPLCGKLIMPPGRGMFPTSPKVSRETQMRNAGWVEEGRCRINGDYPCAECVQAGKATFVCAGCGKEQSGSEIKESFGDPPEYLCKTCYATIPAKEWDEKEAELRESHRWDFD